MSRPLIVFFSLCLSACAAKVLHVEKSEEVLRVEDYEKKVKVKEIEVEAPPPSAPEQVKKAATPKKIKAPPPRSKKSMTHEPSIEDNEGFVGRRPQVDPFRINEKVVLDVKYFNMTAGTLEIGVRPFAEVNGQKAYHFQIALNSSSLFNRIYAVEDLAQTYVDYENLIPHNLSITIKESKQLAETRTFFDWKKMKANYWQKRITKDKGERKKEVTWDILPYSQNVISAAFYLRTFQMKVGKKFAIRVADEGKNILFKGEVLRKETLSTPLGDLETVVVKPELEVDGVFKPVGDILLWLTDDDRKFVVRIESKIKIGSIVAKLRSIDKGRDQ